MLLLRFFFAFFISGFVLCDNDDHGAYVKSYDSETFSTALNSKRNFVMFYAPWCGHCKNLSPTWNELAKIYNKNDSLVAIAKVDCTVHAKLCADQEIIGFPTLKLFSIGGSEPSLYTGKRDLESLKAYLGRQLDEQAVHMDDAATNDKKNGQPVALTDETFESHTGTGLHFVKFYAPWCGHCKRLAPVWDQLGNSLAGSDVSVAKIDCDANSVTCTKYKIRGYPTLQLFYNGEMVASYQGDRTVDALKKFAMTEKEKLSSGSEEEKERAMFDEMEIMREMERMEAEEIAEEENLGTVKDLTSDIFDDFLSDRLVFVKFFAPWCGHCKRLAPVWEDLAKEVEGDPVVIAKVDCTQHKSVCDQHQVRGYPTLKIFRNGEKIEDYRQSRSLDSLTTFVRSFLRERDEL